ncbi:MAG: hypothetical protein FWD09_09405, partial [Lentimicrobiaceae bacterium]|nr:hypothetical protein [Lentimicrobiaceae bacterium]
MVNVSVFFIRLRKYYNILFFGRARSLSSARSAAAQLCSAAALPPSFCTLPPHPTHARVAVATGYASLPCSPAARTGFAALRLAHAGEIQRSV